MTPAAHSLLSLALPECPMLCISHLSSSSQHAWEGHYQDWACGGPARCRRTSLSVASELHLSDLSSDCGCLCLLPFADKKTEVKRGSTACRWPPSCGAADLGTGSGWLRWLHCQDVGRQDEERCLRASVTCWAGRGLGSREMQSGGRALS